MRRRRRQGKNGCHPVLTTSCTSSPSSGRCYLLACLLQTIWTAGPVSSSPSSSSACLQLSSVTWLLTLAAPLASRTRSLLWFLLLSAHQSQVGPRIAERSFSILQWLFCMNVFSCLSILLSVDRLYGSCDGCERSDFTSSQSKHTLSLRWLIVLFLSNWHFGLTKKNDRFHLSWKFIFPLNRTSLGTKTRRRSTFAVQARGKWHSQLSLWAKLSKLWSFGRPS